MTATVEIQKDLEELLQLELDATRSRVKDFMKLEIRRLQTELYKREQLQRAAAGGPAEQDAAALPKAPTAHSTTKTYTEPIRNYAWDQSDKFIKLYVTLKGVHSLDREAVASRYTDKSVQMTVKGLNNKTSELTISRLAEHIDPSGSYHKVKTDTVLVMLKKKQSGKTWSNVTEQDKLAANEHKSKPPALDKDADPSAGLMGMLQNMYEDGDDEMKRMLKKAMYESQTKKGREFSM